MNKAPNLLHAETFCAEVTALFAERQHCEVIVRDEQWLHDNGMNGVLVVNAGSSRPARLLEIHYSPPKPSTAKRVV